MDSRWNLRFVAVLVIAGLAAGCVSRRSAAPPAPSPSGTEPVLVGIVLREFEYEPRPIKVKAGKVRFLLMNRGSAEHDFMISELMGEMQHERDLVQPGQNKTIEVDLKPGTYEVICTVPGHKDAGMRATLEVSS